MCHFQIAQCIYVRQNYLLPHFPLGHEVMICHDVLTELLILKQIMYASKILHTNELPSIVLVPADKESFGESVINRTQLHRTLESAYITCWTCLWVCVCDYYILHDQTLAVRNECTKVQNPRHIIQTGMGVHA